MSARFNLSRAAILTLVLLPLLLAGCGPSGLGGATIGNDPCLLQTYQSRSNGNLGGTQSAYSTLAGQLDALQGPNYTIAPSQDISETLNTIALFQIKLDQQQAYLKNSTPPAPSQARPFLDHVGAAVPDLKTGAYLLAQAYIDAHAGHTVAAKDIADAARVYIRQGRNLLAQAASDLANLHTDSVNC